MKVVYIILFVIFIIVICILAVYNNIIRHFNKVKKAKSNIDIYLKKRFDLIPNLVETVKGYSKHEKGTLEDIVALRNEYEKKDSLSIAESNEMDAKLTKYLLKVEAYPDLKADKQYLELQKELGETEDDLSYARRSYNEMVTNYNTLIESVPSNIVAGMFGFKSVDLFNIKEEEKENIKVSLKEDE